MTSVKITRISGSLWGTTYEMAAVHGDSGRMQAILNELTQRCETAVSRFSPLSELSRVSKDVGDHVVSEDLTDYLESAALGMFLSGGLLDPCIGDALVGLGYDKDFDTLSESSLMTKLPRRRFGEAVSINGESHVFTVRQPCVVDLGATAKARCADLIVRRVLEDGAASGVIIGLGGDLSLAGVAPEDGWPVAIATSAKSTNHGETHRSLSVFGGGVATSSTEVRRWAAGGSEHHHVINPATGQSAVSPWRLVTVLAPSCLEANIAATTAHLQGDSAPQVLADGGFGAFLVSYEGEAIEVGFWPRSAS